MQFEFRHAIKGDLEQMSIAHTRALEKATTQIIRNKTNAAYRAMKRKVERSGFRGEGGKRVARDIGVRVFPPKGTFSTGAVGYIFSRAGYRATRSNRPGRFAPLFDIFQTTTFVRPRTKQWLAIPTDEGLRLAGGARNRRRDVTPRDFKGKLQFIRPRRSRSAILVLKSDPSVVVFILVKQVAIRRKYNILPTYKKSMASIPEAIARRFDRHFPRELLRAKR